MKARDTGFESVCFKAESSHNIYLPRTFKTETTNSKITRNGVLVGQRRNNYFKSVLSAIAFSLSELRRMTKIIGRAKIC